MMELTCAFAVLTVGVFGALQLQMRALDATRVLRDDALAAAALANEIETLRALPFGELRPGAALPFRGDDHMLARLHAAEGRVDIADTGIAGLREVRVEVAWTAETGRRARREATTRIAAMDGGAP
jgi:hypothetical protein